MSLERVLEILAALGLSKTDAEVYTLIAIKGPIEAREIAATLCIERKRFYTTIKKLADSGLIRITSKPSAYLTAVDLEKVLDSYLRLRKEAAQDLQQNRAKILSDWQSMVTNHL